MADEYLIQLQEEITTKYQSYATNLEMTYFMLIQRLSLQKKDIQNQLQELYQNEVNSITTIIIESNCKYNQQHQAASINDISTIAVQPTKQQSDPESNQFESKIDFPNINQ